MSPGLAELLEYSRPLAASDLFLSEGRAPFLRYNTVLTEIEHSPLTREQVAEVFHLTGMDPETTKDCDTTFETPNGLRFRANLHHKGSKLGAVLRHVRSQIPAMDTLGLPDALLTRWLTKQTGIILVTGATGAGKSTSIASCLEWLNNNTSRHIVTIEDPVEYIFQERRCIFTQREIGIDTESFKRGLLSAMRQSPDVVFVGEIRNYETASIALQAAETGQLVITSMQSLGVQDTLYRLLNLFPVEDRSNTINLLASQLQGIICQQLLPGANGGLYLALEHMENTGAIREWIREENPERIIDFMRERRSEGNVTFLDSLIYGCQNHLISPEVGLAACDNELEFTRGMRGVS